MLGVKEKVAKTAKRVTLVSAGAMCCIVGAGFLTVSGWLALVPIVGPATTAVILAGIYLGVGLILLAVSGTETEKTHQQQAELNKPQAQSDAPPIMQAFLFGMQAGASADKRRH